MGDYLLFPRIVYWMCYIDLCPADGFVMMDRQSYIHRICVSNDRNQIMFYLVGLVYVFYVLQSIHRLNPLCKHILRQSIGERGLQSRLCYRSRYVYYITWHDNTAIAVNASQIMDITCLRPISILRRWATWTPKYGYVLWNRQILTYQQACFDFGWNVDSFV